jgi:hypothetical protein
METGNWIALGAVGVAVCGNWVTWKLGLRRFTHERDLDDRQVTGESLEAAAVELHEVAYLLDDIRAGLRGRPLSYFHIELGEEAFEQLERAGRGIDERSERLCIRLKDAPPATTFERIKETTLALYRLAWRIRDETRDLPDPGDAKEQLRDFVRDKRSEMEGLREQFDRQREDFRTAAYGAVGVRLPPETPD